MSFLPQDSGDDERPECEYGLECYRKNPQHRKDFKHSVKPQPTRKAKEVTKKKKATSKDADDEYESDFIDDEEDGWEPIDDSDDDADWAPQEGSQEEEDDDTQELQVNAKKRKKVYDDNESEAESIVGDNIEECSSP